MAALWCHCGAVIVLWQKCGDTVLILWCTLVTVRLYYVSTYGSTVIEMWCYSGGYTVVPLWWICDRRATAEVLWSLSLC